MPDLLLELFSEEIPARMQARAADDLKKLVTDGLVEAGLTYDGARAFATPRRLALNVVGIPAASPAPREARRGPRVGAPEKALEEFFDLVGPAIKVAVKDTVKVKPQDPALSAYVGVYDLGFGGETAIVRWEDGLAALYLRHSAEVGGGRVRFDVVAIRGDHIEVREGAF
jgi:hypothetical protein